MINLNTNNRNNPNIDDSIQADFQVYWLNKSTREKGDSTFFTYDNGAEIIETVFETMYPEREILQIIELAS
jgi:hypothetical protein